MNSDCRIIHMRINVYGIWVTLRRKAFYHNLSFAQTSCNFCRATFPRRGASFASQSNDDESSRRWPSLSLRSLSSSCGNALTLRDDNDDNSSTSNQDGTLLVITVEVNIHVWKRKVRSICNFAGLSLSTRSTIFGKSHAKISIAHRLCFHCDRKTSTIVFPPIVFTRYPERQEEKKVSRAGSE